MIGKSIAEANWGREHDVKILKVYRKQEKRHGLSRFRLRREQHLTSETILLDASADTRLELDDVLLVEGEKESIAEVAVLWSLGLQAADPEDERALINEESGVAEVILPPRSRLVGKTLVDTRFANTYGLTVVAIKRPGSSVPLDINDTELRFGDSLLVCGTWENIMALKERRRDFVVTGQPVEFMA